MLTISKILLWPHFKTGVSKSSQWKSHCQSLWHLVWEWILIYWHLGLVLFYYFFIFPRYAHSKIDLCFGFSCYYLLVEVIVFWLYMILFTGVSHGRICSLCQSIRPQVQAERGYYILHQTGPEYNFAEGILCSWRQREHFQKYPVLTFKNNLRATCTKGV